MTPAELHRTAVVPGAVAFRFTGTVTVESTVQSRGGCGGPGDLGRVALDCQGGRAPQKKPHKISSGELREHQESGDQGC